MRGDPSGRKKQSQNTGWVRVVMKMILSSESVCLVVRRIRSRWRRVQVPTREQIVTRVVNTLY